MNGYHQDVRQESDDCALQLYTGQNQHILTLTCMFKIVNPSKELQNFDHKLYLLIDTTPGIDRMVINSTDKILSVMLLSSRGRFLIAFPASMYAYINNVDQFLNKRYIDKAAFFL